MVAVDEYAAALSDAIGAAVPGWVERTVARTLDRAGCRPDPGVRQRAADAGRRAQADVMARLDALLSTDVDDQSTTPLAILRDAVRYPTEVLRAVGVPPVERDPQQRRLFPDDVYDLSPATFADIDPLVADAGLRWGAAKAHTHLQRHGSSP